MIAMLHHAIAAREPHTPPSHCTSSMAREVDSDRPFGAHLQELASRHPAVSMHLFDSAADRGSHAASGTLPGRVSVAEIKRCCRSTTTISICVVPRLSCATCMKDCAR